MLVDGVDVRDVDPDRCAARWRWCPTTPSCSPPRCATTSPTPARTPATRRWSGRRAAPAWPSSSRTCPRATTRCVGERGAHAVRRPAPARGDRPGAARRAAHPRPRRRHLQRGRHHREPHQGRALRGDGGPHHLRDRPPSVHDRPGRRGRGARGRARSRRTAPTASCSRPRRSTARSPRRACPTRCSSPQDPVEREVAGAVRRRLDRRLELIRRQEDQRTRKLRDLRRRCCGRTARMVVLMLWSLLVVGHRGVARAALPRRPSAIDDGIMQKDVAHAQVIVVAVRGRRALVNWGATYAQTYLSTGSASARSRTSASRCSPTCSGSRSASTRATTTGVLISRLTNDVRGARPARHRRHGDALLVRADADRQRP